MDDQNSEITALIDALLRIDRLKVKEIFSLANPHVDPIERIENLVSPALEWIGSEWEQGRLSLSQVYMSGRICEDMVNEILPASQTHGISQPTMAIAVLEDYHTLGKRIVYSMLRSVGYVLLDYGRVTVDELIKNIIQDRIEIILIAVLMLPSALRVKELRQRLDLAGLPVKIIVGGAPFRFDLELWREVGADGCGNTASDALQLVRGLSGAQS
jgi:trimethylamine corrinoid protein